MKLRYLILLFSLYCSLAAKADSFEARISGKELAKVTAIEFKIGFTPVTAYTVEEDFEITYIAEEGDASQELSLGDKVLYKMTDSSNSFLRFFLIEPIKAREYIIRGNLKRGNYSGKSKIDIRNVDYVSDFASDLNLDQLSTSIVLKTSDDILPFIGISKAEILGPDTRIFSHEMFVVIGNIETYGFSLKQAISNITINGKPAKLISGEIIAANLTLASKDIKQLPIVLEMEVDNRFIKKEIGSLTIQEAIE